MKLSSIFIRCGFIAVTKRCPIFLQSLLLSSYREKRFASERRDFITSKDASQAFKSKSLYLRDRL